MISILEDTYKVEVVKFDGWLTGFTVLTMLIIILIINIIIERYKHNSLLSMIRKSERNIEVTVIRDGKEFVTKQTELLVGDIIILSGGDSIPADCLVIEANLQAQVDESYLTPDTNPVQKQGIKVFEETVEKMREDNSQLFDEIDTPDPFLLASTLVIAGRMKALV